MLDKLYIVCHYTYIANKNLRFTNNNSKEVDTMAKENLTIQKIINDNLINPPKYKPSYDGKEIAEMMNYDPVTFYTLMNNNGKFNPDKVQRLLSNLEKGMEDSPNRYKTIFNLLSPFA